jgi:hypothetical protein
MEEIKDLRFLLLNFKCLNNPTAVCLCTAIYIEAVFSYYLMAFLKMLSRRKDFVFLNT